MRQETIRLTVPGVTRHHTFYYTSDAHVACAQPTDTEAAKLLAEKQTQAWSRFGIPPLRAFEEALSLAGQNRAEGLFLCGDIGDYYSPAILSYLQAQLKQLTQSFVQPLFVCGNHEGASYDTDGKDLRHCHPAYAPLMQGNASCWARDYEDLLVVGLDNGDHRILPEQLHFLMEQTHYGKPILLLMHIPLRTPAIVPDVIAKWGKDGCTYFTLDESVSDPTTQQFCQLLKQPDNNIAAIFAGHIHVHHVGEFAPGKMQFTSAPTFMDVIWRIEIQPEPSAD